MTCRPFGRRLTVFALLVALVFPQGIVARQEDKLAALKQSLGANAKQLKQYKWVETTVISMKGEEKSRIQKQCFYGPDGKVQKQQLSAPPPEQEPPGGMKGKIAAKKKAEISAKMKDAAALIQSYVPPDPQRIQAVKTAGNLSMSPTGPNSARLDLRGYAKKGDNLSIGLDTSRNSLLTLGVQSYLEDEKDAVTLDVTFATLRDGVSYPGSVVLNVPGEKIQVVVQNSGYQRVAGAAPAPAPAKPAAAKPAAAKPAASGTPGASTSAMDNLVAPIALYPDALVAQMLEASTDFATVQKFSGWLKSNAALTGSDLMAAAQKAGFGNAYVALAPFPQVVQTLVDKPDWTKQLGAAYKADPNGVYDAIQRLRAAAYALGNLKTTEQQEVVTETTASGTQIIVVQPANPQVVYVPVYNTQVVYVQPAPPPPPPSSSSSDVAAAALVGFTVGIIIGASCNNYYHGPYAWRGGGAHYAYERREDYVDYREDRYDDKKDYAEDNRSTNQSQRQSTAQEGQTQRQSQAQTKQSEAQGQAQAKQSEAQGKQAEAQGQAQAKQSEAQGKQAEAQGQAQAKQGEAQAKQGEAQAKKDNAQAKQGQAPAQQPSQGQRQTTQSSRQTTASTSSAGSGQAATQRSGAFGGTSSYQSGGTAKAQSARGKSSRSSSRSGGGRSRR